MRKDTIPKWQRELQSFLGVKSGIILEGSIYDEFPLFSFNTDEVDFQGMDNLDQTILNMVEQEGGTVIYCDPLDGFYCYEGDLTEQRKTLQPMLEGYRVKETLRNHGCTVCMLPCEKTGATGDAAEIYRLAWVSEIVRRAMAGDAYHDERWLVFVLNFASRLDTCNLQRAESDAMFVNFLAATTDNQISRGYCNTLMFVVDKYNDIPAWVYLNNPNIRTISVGVPDRVARRLYLEHVHGRLQPFSILGRDDYDVGAKFVAETEGLQCQELGQVLKLAYKTHIMPEEIHQAFQLYKYGVTENPWDRLEFDVLARVKKTLEERVKGQENALSKVMNVVTRAVKGFSGLQHSNSLHKPRGILFFAGPTGVGKTETAKALAESLFGDESACIRFDMSEYRQEQSDQKLFGAPPGYVGYEGGGQLTNEVKKRPFSILLFDEIEKASPTILDKFLQILEDGRMTDNQGNTVYFGETIIIFTSNIGLTKIEYDQYGRPKLDEAGEILRVPSISIEDPHTPDTDDFRKLVEVTLKKGVKNYFTSNGRPELLNRLGEDNIVVFQFIDVDGAEAICQSKLLGMCETIKKQKGIEIIVDDILVPLKAKAVLERANGGRGVGNMLEREFLNPLAACICDLPDKPNVLRCHMDSNKQVVFEVI